MFQNRIEAGKRLAKSLRRYEVDQPVVMALPRGGVPVGYEIANSLSAPLDVLLVKKIGHPRNPEFAIGAISEDGGAVVNDELISALGVDRMALAEEVKSLTAVLRDEAWRLRGGILPVDLTGRTVILTDDGISTGSTMLHAIDVLQRKGVAHIIVATPVCPADAAQLLRREDVDLVTLDEPEFFVSVGQWYRDFEDVGDEEANARLISARARHASGAAAIRDFRISEGKLALEAEAGQPEKIHGWVIFAHGSGSSRRSPRNRRVAEALNQAGFATLLFDLLTEDEDRDPANRFNIPLLADRLVMATFWLRTQGFYREEPIGYFGASTGGAAALMGAERSGNDVSAVVSRGGRPDLAGQALERVPCPVLLIVGGNDDVVLELNRQAADRLPDGELVVIPGATHLFEEPGKMEKVEEYTVRWFAQAFKRSVAA
jgi:putative phosphoribosyl transferase